MSALISRLTGGKQTDTATDAAIDFGGLRAALGDRLRPFVERINRLQTQYHDWFQREVARGSATMTGDAETMASSALLKVQHEQQSAARAFFAAQWDAQLRGALEAHVQAVRLHYAATAAAMESLRTFQEHLLSLAASCASAVPTGLDDSAITDFGFRHWDLRVTRALNPPKPVPSIRAVDNPLVLD